MHCCLEIWNLDRVKADFFAVFRTHSFARAQPTAYISLRATRSTERSGTAASTRRAMGKWEASLACTCGHRRLHPEFLNSFFFFFHLPVRIRKVWQKRKCSVKNGFLTISHGTVSIPPPPRSLLQGDERGTPRRGRRSVRSCVRGAVYRRALPRAARPGSFCVRHAGTPFTRLRPGKRVIFWYPAESGVTDEPGGLCSERQTDRQTAKRPPATSVSRN